MKHIVAWESYYNTVKTELAATIYTPLFVLFMRCYSPLPSDCPAALRLTRVEVSSGAWNGAISGAGVFAGTQQDPRHGRIGSGPVARKLTAKWKNGATSGEALASAMRMRVAV
jgi:hypothetical protein